MKSLFRYELKFLFGAKLTYGLLLLLFVLISYSVSTRQNKIRAYRATVDSLYNKQWADVNTYKKKLDSVITFRVKESYLRQSPKNPYSLVFNIPLYAIFPVDERAIISTGQSDVFANYFVNNDDWKNPVITQETPTTPFQQLFGVVDLAFVLVYLLPIIIIAFSFNLVSSEREQGTLQMLLVLPRPLITIFLLKTTIRLLLVYTTVVAATLSSFWINGVSFLHHLPALWIFLGVVFLYSSFWFLLALFINLKGRSSGANAVMLLSAWLFFLLILPVILNMTISSAFPAPSRLAYTSTFWKISNENEKQERNEVLDKFYQDHPELVLKQDTLSENKEWSQLFEFYKWVLASTEDMSRKIQPVLESYSSSAKKRTRLANSFRFLSPSIVMQDELDNLAGTSTADYQRFFIQSENSRKVFSAMLRKKIFEEQFVNEADLDKVASLIRRSSYQPVFSWANILSLLLYVSVLACLLGFSQKWE